MSNNQISSPILFFTFDPSNNGFNRGCVLENLQAESLQVDIFQESLIRNIEKKENLVSRGNNIQNANFGNFSENEYINQSNFSRPAGNAEILEQQRREMENILREEERQKRLKIEEEKRIKKEVSFYIKF